MCLVFETLGEVFQWNNLPQSDAMCAETDGLGANEQLLKGGKTYRPIVLNNNNNSSSGQSAKGAALGALRVSKIT